MPHQQNRCANALVFGVPVSTYLRHILLSKNIHMGAISLQGKKPGHWTISSRATWKMNPVVFTNQMTSLQGAQDLASGGFEHFAVPLQMFLDKGVHKDQHYCLELQLVRIVKH